MKSIDQGGSRRLLLVASAAAAAVVLFAVLPVAEASSFRPPPLAQRAISHPSSLTVQIIPSNPSNPSTAPSRRAVAPRAYLDDQQQPAFDDRFLLSFWSHDAPVTLSLRPAANLVHPSGIKTVHTHTDEHGARTTRTSYLARSDVRAYEGWVVESQTEAELKRWVSEEMAGVKRTDSARNWARLVLLDPEDDDDELRFQGSFALDDDIFTIHSTENYLKTRHDLDPDPPLLRKRTLAGTFLSHPSMVVVRERDVLSSSEHLRELRKRGLPLPNPMEASKAALCAHDYLPFNLDPSHPVYEQSESQAVFSAGDGVAYTPWLKTVFRMPAASYSSPALAHINAKKYGYPPRASLGKRQSDTVGSTNNASSNFINSIGSTTGCPKSAMVLFMGAALDCTYVAHYGSADAARTQILTDFNSASSLYSNSFNVSLGLVELNVQSGACPTTSAEVDQSNPWNVGCPEGGGPGLDLNTRLSTFSQWRGDKGGADGAGLWTLMTNCSTGSEVGVSWLGQLCRVSASSGSSGTTSGTSVTAVTRTEYQGAIHDCVSGCSLTNSNPVCCPQSTTSCDTSSNYIMSPVSSKNVSSFSPCSVGNICTALSSSLNTTCLAVPGAAGNPTVISLKSCGNGIVEAGEDCDPGSNDDPCCDASTCKFASGAVCSPLNALCCSSTCQVASAGTVCRASVDAQCDREEVCSGTSSDCPDDSYVSDGTHFLRKRIACVRLRNLYQSGSSVPGSWLVTQFDVCLSHPCDAGTCSDSQCVSGSALEVAKSWYRQNLQISIPVTIVAAVVVLLIIAAIWRCCVRRSRANTTAKQAGSARYGAAPPMAAVGGKQRRKFRGARSSGADLEPPMRDSGRSSQVPSNSSLGNQPFLSQPPPAGMRQGREPMYGYESAPPAGAIGYVPPPPPRRYPENGQGPWMPSSYQDGNYR
ncbi:zinc metalloprotease [Pseudohyphozyma bogoriensis]|nr:zinc metalloprotease [Pseudohyphozyma bogoriensis]